MLAAATLPAAIARMAVAGPVTQSPPAKTPGMIVNHAVRQCLRGNAALDGTCPLCSKCLGLDALADGDDDHIRRDAHSALFAAAETFARAPRVDFADDLRLRP